jgi:hypothetical protein
MNGFVYFLPGCSTAGGDVLAGMGLADVLDGPRSCGHVADGPGGEAGMMVRLAGVEITPTRWIPATETRPYRIGYDPDHPPGPEDLMRRNVLRGPALTLADGRDWVCPVARLFTGENLLPKTYVLDEDGNEAVRTVDRYAGLWDTACEFLRRYIGVTVEGEEVRDPGLSPAEILATAVTALGANYHVGDAELRLMAALDDSACLAVCRALVDFETIERLCTKASEDEHKKNDCTTTGDASCGVED